MKRFWVAPWVLLLAGCSFFRNDFAPPDVTLAGLRLGQGDGLYQTLLVDLVLSNPNASDLKLNAISYRVKVEGRELASGASREPLTVPAHGTATYTMPATISLMSSFGFVRDVLTKSKSKVGYELTATLEPSGLFSIPLTVRKSDTLSLTQ